MATGRIPVQVLANGGSRPPLEPNIRYIASVRTLCLLAICTLFAIIRLAPGVAHASDRASSPACEDFATGQKHERDLHFPEALLAYRTSAARVPSGPCTEDSRRRVEALLEVAEGDFGPWTALERARRTPSIEGDTPALEALLDASSHFPVGKVKGETRFLVGLALLRIEPARGVVVLNSVVSDPFANKTTRRQALRRSAETLALTHPAEALRLIQEHSEIASAELVASLKRLQRRGWGHRISIAIVSLFVAASGIGVARGRARVVAHAQLRRELAVCLGFGALVAGLGSLMVSLYERGHAMPFVALGGALALIAFMARMWRLASPPGPLRGGMRALLSATSSMAAAFLILENFNVQYLEAFGC